MDGAKTVKEETVKIRLDSSVDSANVNGLMYASGERDGYRHAIRDVGFWFLIAMAYLFIVRKLCTE